ncbi:hypothetical protein B9Z55_028717 [Caenorhabditis nigoni]|uniref:Uncharacterized protein n=1 Tax=Caenorhabditis nigoni TaxID=1611254 RepID=A0A2G5SAV1_9PELO|nr:hypothetical protein B9Z55_028717 [Caenorhabditis nigoni]
MDYDTDTLRSAKCNRDASQRYYNMLITTLLFFFFPFPISVLLRPLSQKRNRSRSYIFMFLPFCFFLPSKKQGGACHSGIYVPFFLVTKFLRHSKKWSSKPYSVLIRYSTWQLAVGGSTIGMVSIGEESAMRSISLFAAPLAPSWWTFGVSRF